MTKNAGISVGLLAGLGFLACYNTNNVKNGGLLCGPNDACPDGYGCIKDGQPGTLLAEWYRPRRGRAGLRGGNRQVRSLRELQPRASPSPTAPAIRSANRAARCDRRCTIEPSTLASFHCEAAPPPSSFVPVQGTCTNNANSCEPGSLCISDDVCPWQCFRMCRRDGDCPGNTVARRLGRSTSPANRYPACGCALRRPRPAIPRAPLSAPARAPASSACSSQASPAWPTPTVRFATAPARMTRGRARPVRRSSTTASPATPA